MRAMETLHDLIEEAKIRAAWWAICIFAISYFLSHTSKSMWTNIPLAFLMLCALRLLFHEVEFHWKVQPVRQQSYLSHLQKHQLSLDDPLISPYPVAKRWKRRIDSPLVEAAVDDFISKILQDFMIDLWYSAITPDKEVPEQIHMLIKDVIGEISGRIKAINLVELLTRDMVDLLGDHLDLYRRNQSYIGVDVMATLSSEERDERLRHHLIVSEELHPALFSIECEYKILQRLMEGVLAVVLRPREAECPLVRSLGREFLTCLVMQPVMNFASPGYINELIEFIFLAASGDISREVSDSNSNEVCRQIHDRSVAHGTNQSVEPHMKITSSSSYQLSDLSVAKIHGHDYEGPSSAPNLHGHTSTYIDSLHDLQPRFADWARVLDAAQERRTQVLAPENLENLWTKGRNHARKNDKFAIARASKASTKTSAAADSISHIKNRESGKLTNLCGVTVGTAEKSIVQIAQGSNAHESRASLSKTHLLHDSINEQSLEGFHPAAGSSHGVKNKTTLKRSNSTSALKIHLGIENAFAGEDRDAMDSSEFHNAFVGRGKATSMSASALIFGSEGSPNTPKIKCRVTGAYFEKNGSKSFAVYSIAVKDAENKAWVVKRRYRNFERLHRHLKDIPNYTLQLPPKRFLSSSVDDSFVHKRCILLDKYLQDLLSIANVAEQHEVWDFLSVSSKNYAFGKSSSVMRTLAVNVDDAMDDIVRQFKRKVSGSSSTYAASPAITDTHLNWNEDESSKPSPSYIEASDNDDEGSKHGSHEEADTMAVIDGWHSDNELNSKGFPPRVVKRHEDSDSLVFERSQNSETKFGKHDLDRCTVSNSFPVPDPVNGLVQVPPEWTPPNFTLPLLTLVDKIFQLKRRGWLRRQVFWISKQILQLMMEDAIDDWLLRQINLLRRDDIVAQGIRWVQDALWPNGKFFLNLETGHNEMTADGFHRKPIQNEGRFHAHKASGTSSFELQLEATRRARDVKKMLLDGAPTALVSLIGHKQYQRCAKDIYYFLQSTVCLKQLAYCMLESLLISIFPELRDLIQDIHRKAHFQGKAV